MPNIEGINLNNVFTLRDYNNNQSIKKAALSAKNIVIIGANFIGMEMASNIKKLHPNANVTVVESKTTPFEKVLGKEVGSALQK
jgi:NADPH-dependent 2,4-dienoyl-CoA reductase/sulfur reductase-like enzyme